MATHQCVIAVAKRGTAQHAVQAARRQGARGATVLGGKGSSVFESRAKKLFGALLEPEKEIVLVVVEREKAEAVAEEIRRELDLDTPGKGIVFVFDISSVRGLTPLDALAEDDDS